jgi:hypothetical protein
MQKSSSTRIKFIESDLEALEKKKKKRRCTDLALVNLGAHVETQL